MFLFLFKKKIENKNKFFTFIFILFIKKLEMNPKKSSVWDFCDILHAILTLLCLGVKRRVKFDRNRRKIYRRCCRVCSFWLFLKMVLVLTTQHFSNWSCIYLIQFFSKRNNGNENNLKNFLKGSHTEKEDMARGIWYFAFPWRIWWHYI